jgi:hypothetical protein
MAEPQLIDYIKKARSAGQGDEQSRSLLLKNGWTDTEVNEAFSAIDPGQAQTQQQPRTQPQPEVQPEPQVESQPRPQLVDHINKARRDGTPDDQSRSFLVKNGWTDEELNDAFASAEPAQPKIESQVSGQPQINIQPEVASQPKTQYQPQYENQLAQNNRPRTSGGAVRLILKLFVVLILLAIIGAGGYFAITQKDLLNNLFNKVVSYSTKIFSTNTSPSPAVENNENEANNEEPSSSLDLTDQKIVTVPQEYDASKITVAAFSEARDKITYCAPEKASNKISCFLNDQKLFDNPYSFKPYWIGISPNGLRIVFFYFDSVKKQSFTFENSTESARYNGTLTYPKFSQDSQSFMFMVMGNDTKNFIVLNGKPGAPHDKIYTVPAFSKDGKYIFYGVRDGQDLFWIADEIYAASEVNEGE